MDDRRQFYGSPDSLTDFKTASCICQRFASTSPGFQSCSEYAVIMIHDKVQTWANGIICQNIQALGEVEVKANSEFGPPCISGQSSSDSAMFHAAPLVPQLETASSVGTPKCADEAWTLSFDSLNAQGRSFFETRKKMKDALVTLFLFTQSDLKTTFFPCRTFSRAFTRSGTTDIPVTRCSLRLLHYRIRLGSIRLREQVFGSTSISFNSASPTRLTGEAEDLLNKPGDLSLPDVFLARKPGFCDGL